MGFETRYVLDFTDHVWTEVYLESERRWIHCDSCEGSEAIDTPLLYETGWGKKLTYVIGFGDDGCKDLTERYTKQFDIVLKRRNLVTESWLNAKISATNINIRNKFSDEYRKYLQERDDEEEKDIVKNRSHVSSSLPPRQSGSIDWRKERGEMG